MLGSVSAIEGAFAPYCACPPPENELPNRLGVIVRVAMTVEIDETVVALSCAHREYDKNN